MLIDHFGSVSVYTAQLNPYLLWVPGSAEVAKQEECHEHLTVLVYKVPLRMPALFVSNEKVGCTKTIILEHVHQCSGKRLDGFWACKQTLKFIIGILHKNNAILLVYTQLSA